MNLEELVSSVQSIAVSFQHNFIFALAFLGVFWVCHILNWAVNYRLNVLGIYPRSIRGLFGIVFTPFLHRDFNHLFFNSIPLFVLAILILQHNRTHFYYTSATIILLSGLGIWLFGKRAIHIGASSLVMGYFGYLLANAYYQFNAESLILALLALYYFGGLFLALIPSSHKEVSWSGHLFGFLAGIAAAYLF